MEGHSASTGRNHKSKGAIRACGGGIAVARRFSEALSWWQVPGELGATSFRVRLQDRARHPRTPQPQASGGAAHTCNATGSACDVSRDIWGCWIGRGARSLAKSREQLLRAAERMASRYTSGRSTSLQLENQQGTSLQFDEQVSVYVLVNIRYVVLN